MRYLITGATSGIGLAFARQLAERGDALVLVARDGDRLAAVAESLRPTAHVETIAADLLVESDLERITARLRTGEDPVDVLVNNAGIGLPPGGYLGNDIGASRTVTALSVDAVMRLTHAALPGMQRRGRGGILVVASIAAFVPGTPAITYSAAKAWALAFGEGLNTLLWGTGVHSTVTAPGFVRSEFHRRSGVDASGLPDRLWLDADLVARESLAGFARNRPLVIPGRTWRAMHVIGTRLPRSWPRRAFAALMSRPSRSSKKART